MLQGKWEGVRLCGAPGSGDPPHLSRSLTGGPWYGTFGTGDMQCLRPSGLCVGSWLPGS